jgi:regulator of RNase E activity RraA
MSEPLSTEELNLLRAINTPTIANAIEVLGFRERSEGFTNSSIRCMFPDLGVMVGYAITATIRSATPPDKSRAASMKAYWDHIANFPAPRVVVVQDLSQPAAGAWWGEVNSNIHRALGCIGLVTDGTVRDLDEVRPLGFQFLACGHRRLARSRAPRGFQQAGDRRRHGCDAGRFDSRRQAWRDCHSAVARSRTIRRCDSRRTLRAAHHSALQVSGVFPRRSLSN